MAALGALTFFIVGPGACTEVNDRLGEGLIPKNQRMEIEVTSPASNVKTFLYREKSVPSSRSGHAYFGRATDSEGIFGTQTSSAILQFVPISVPYSGIKGYGIDPIVDSAVLLMSFTDARGDTLVPQRFDVWELAPGANPPLRRDSTYRTDFPIDDYRGEKLFTFTHTGGRDVEARLVPTAAGKAYLNRIVNIEPEDWDSDYMTDSMFHKKFPGLYIAPAPDVTALYGFDLTQAGIQLHGRNHDTLDVSAIYDTLTTAFLFRDTDAPQTQNSAAVPWNNVSVNMNTFDYSGSKLGDIETLTKGFTDTLPTTGKPLSTLYVQAMNGVGTYLRFTDDLVEEIRNLRFKTDGAGQKTGKNIAINQAVMRIWIEDDTVEGLDASIPRLGAYLNPNTLFPVPDYQYATEANENLRRKVEAQRQGTTAYTEYTLPYGGYLNRSNGYYELDITSYIQQLSRTKEDDPEFQYISPAIFLAPEAYGIVGFGESVLKGFDSDRPISIKITYTIIEG
jgi:hypothetical protein